MFVRRWIVSYAWQCVVDRAFDDLTYWKLFGLCVRVCSLLRDSRVHTETGVWERMDGWVVWLSEKHIMKIIFPKVVVRHEFVGGTNGQKKNEHEFGNLLKFEKWKRFTVLQNFFNCSFGRQQTSKLQWNWYGRWTKWPECTQLKKLLIYLETTTAVYSRRYTSGWLDRQTDQTDTDRKTSPFTLCDSH